ncbi:MAG: polymer-forming cytoskeletal protein, partial [Dethiobacteria bacterium]|nr:polymer-forming cytoskeletal protein [Dethiobacteria bacterium]
IGESGRVKVELKARNVTIAGYYEGSLEAEGKLELKKTATAIGTFKTNGLLVEEGAVVSGSLEMKAKNETAPAGSKNYGVVNESNK